MILFRLVKLQHMHWRSHHVTTRRIFESDNRCFSFYSSTGLPPLSKSDTPFMIFLLHVERTDWNYAAVSVIELNKLPFGPERIVRALVNRLFQ